MNPCQTLHMSFLVNNNLKYVFALCVSYLHLITKYVIDWKCDIIARERRHILQSRMNSMNPERTWLTGDSSDPS